MALSAGESAWDVSEIGGLGGWTGVTADDVGLDAKADATDADRGFGAGAISSGSGLTPDTGLAGAVGLGYVVDVFVFELLKFAGGLGAGARLCVTNISSAVLLSELAFFGGREGGSLLFEANDP